MAEEDLKASLKEKEILMQEIHHRVKNNMQIISSLMKLQSRKFRDNRLKEVFRECHGRIQAMTLVHETLLSNSLKHAFPEGQKGNIEIRARLTENGEIELAVSDNGVGLPDGFDLHNTETLGLELVTGLVESQKPKYDC